VHDVPSAPSDKGTAPGVAHKRNMHLEQCCDIEDSGSLGLLQARMISDTQAQCTFRSNAAYSEVLLVSIIASLSLCSL